MDSFSIVPLCDPAIHGLPDLRTDRPDFVRGFQNFGGPGPVLDFQFLRVRSGHNLLGPWIII